MSPLIFLKTFNSCIYLLFTNQQKLITDSGIHPSLHSNCHHQIIYGKFNLKIFYPPPYERHIWHYKHANTDMISKAIQGFDWDKAFLDKSAEEKASILTKTLLNIMSNFIPNEIVTTDDRDSPWINNKIKSLIKNKTEYFKNCVKPNNPDSKGILNKCTILFQQVLKFLNESIISNFLENLQLIKSILNVTGPH